MHVGPQSRDEAAIASRASRGPNGIKVQVRESSPMSWPQRLLQLQRHDSRVREMSENSRAEKQQRADLHASPAMQLLRLGAVLLIGCLLICSVHAADNRSRLINAWEGITISNVCDHQFIWLSCALLKFVDILRGHQLLEDALLPAELRLHDRLLPVVHSGGQGC